MKRIILSVNGIDRWSYPINDNKTLSVPYGYIASLSSNDNVQITIKEVSRIKITIYHEGDMSVGISGNQTSMILDDYNPDTDREAIGYLIHDLKNSFSELWDFPTHVITEEM